MACGCENRKLAGELDRIRKLAKALAQMEAEVVAIYRNDDDTYGFATITNEINKPIVEYISNL